MQQGSDAGRAHRPAERCARQPQAPRPQDSSTAVHFRENAVHFHEHAHAITYSNASDETSLPFHVRLDRHDPVHVLDSENLEIVFAELDTFGDFIAYLD